MILNVNSVPVFTHSISFSFSVGSRSFNKTFLTTPCERPVVCLRALALSCVSLSVVFWLPLCSWSFSPQCHRRQEYTSYRQYSLIGKKKGSVPRPKALAFALASWLWWFPAFFLSISYWDCNSYFWARLVQERAFRFNWSPCLTGYKQVLSKGSLWVGSFS